MPTYEYQCDSCHAELERLQSITDEPLTDCPKCEGRLRRRISGGGAVIFRGTGFYETDYKRREPGGGKDGDG